MQAVHSSNGAAASHSGHLREDQHMDEEGFSQAPHLGLGGASNLRRMDRVDRKRSEAPGRLPRGVLAGEPTALLSRLRCDWFRARLSELQKKFNKACVEMTVNMQRQHVESLRAALRQHAVASALGPMSSDDGTAEAGGLGLANGKQAASAATRAPSIMPGAFVMAEALASRLPRAKLLPFDPGANGFQFRPKLVLISA
jgi:hypothetical protein